jgi:putative Holliday junction resolvase
MSVPAVPLPAANLQTFPAFDFGVKRAGVATGNRLTGTGIARGSIAAEGDAKFAAFGLKIRDWQPDALVVGIPFHPDGASHDNTVRAQKFARQLRDATASRCLRLMSATARPRPWPAARRTPMRHLPA